MSRAFVKEPDGDLPEDLPELPISAQPNYVTARGLGQLRKRLADCEQALAVRAADAANSRQSRALIERDIRWLQARLASAQWVPQDNRNPGRVAFGAEVRVADQDDRQQVYQIVGEDEAEPDAGRISWTSPLARALIGTSVGDVVTWSRPAGDLDIEVLEIHYRV